MKGSRRSWLVVLVSIAVCVFLFGPSPVRAADNVALLPQDCVKCHEAPPADIAAAGAKHKTEVTCVDCHAGHRPTSKNNIPKCSQCHEGKPHYGLKNCLECHRNPHKPLNIAIAAKTTEPCLTCHTEQIKQLKENPSRHSAQYCSSCHDVHRKIPDCVKCHKPHSSEMAQADCKRCHKAHKPKVVVYAADVPNNSCGACHKKALALLSASATKHKNLACVKCHENRHKTVPACELCHGSKHPEPIMKKFPKCGTCHNIAHDLNHWTEGGKVEQVKTLPAPAKAEKKRRR